MLLEVDEIHTFFGKSHILHGVSLEMEKGRNCYSAWEEMGWASPRR